jgi:Ca2+/Na+ antiporter
MAWMGTRRRAAGWFGVAFVVLLLLQAGMADIPTSDASIERIQAFYADNGGIVLAAQAISVVASILFLVFVSSLARDVRSESGPGSRRVRVAGAMVAIASLATALPPILLALASSPSDATARGLTRAGDVTDAVLFLAIGMFSLALFRDAEPAWLKALAIAVAALSIARSVLGFADVTALDVIAPLAFLVLVVALSVTTLRGRLAARVTAGEHDPQ